MDERRWSAVDAYFTRTIVRQDGALEAALAANAAAGLPQIDVSPPHGKLLHLLARMAGARKALEIGALGGYSAIWIARALPPEGRLVTLEADENACEGRAGERCARGPERKGRHPRRPGARQSAEDRGGGARAVRFRLHRRRQVEQCELPDLGAAPVAAGNRDRRRQCGPGGRDRRRRGSRIPARAGVAPDVRDDGARAAPRRRRRSRRSAPRAGTVSRWRSSGDVRARSRHLNRLGALTIALRDRVDRPRRGRSPRRRPDPRRCRGASRGERDTGLRPACASPVVSPGAAAPSGDDRSNARSWLRWLAMSGSPLADCQPRS